MITHIITRFSILDYDFKGYKLTTKLDKDTYYKTLFSSERLDYKFKSFEMITLPSILNQTNQNYIWHIYTSEYLPNVYKEKLMNITNQHKSIRVYYIKSFKEFNNITFNDDYCTMRLDDDDGLSPQFIENLQQYKNKSNTIISHPNGKYVTIQDDKVVIGKTVSLPNCALGLCAIGMNIHECGNHTKVAEKFSVIYDNTPDMYMINANIHCDSSRKFAKD
jgi:hypothetical protein